MGTENHNSPRSSKDSWASRIFEVKEGIVVIFHLLAMAFTILGPIAVFGYQVVHWAKYGEWLSLPISVTGFVAWKGIASLPLSLGVFCVGLVTIFVIVSFYPEEKSNDA